MTGMPACLTAVDKLTAHSPLSLDLFPTIALMKGKHMASPLEIYREYQKRLRAQDFDHLGEVVNLEGFTETCLGLTPRWTIGFDVALQNVQKNIFSAFSEMQMTTEEIVEGQETVVLRNRTEATHTGEFLGIPPTGRRFSYDSITIAHVKDGRFVGQWVQLDLWGIYQQLTAAERREA